MKKNRFHFRVLTTLLFLILVSQMMPAQGVNNIIVLPANPTTNDTILIVSDFSYYGDCAAGLLGEQYIYADTIISILPGYCGYGDSTLCHVVDTFSLGILSEGNYTVNIEYHQGTVCFGGFDAIIANADITFQVEIPLSIDSVEMANNEITIYPNPTSDYITIQHPKPIKAFHLIDITGKEIKVTSFENVLDLRVLSSGIYSLNILFENGDIITRKIIKNDIK